MPPVPPNSFFARRSRRTRQSHPAAGPRDGTPGIIAELTAPMETNGLPPRTSEAGPTGLNFRSFAFMEFINSINTDFRKACPESNESATMQAPIPPFDGSFVCGIGPGQHQAASKFLRASCVVFRGRAPVPTTARLHHVFACPAGRHRVAAGVQIVAGNAAADPSCPNQRPAPDGEIAAGHALIKKEFMYRLLPDRDPAMAHQDISEGRQIPEPGDAAQCQMGRKCPWIGLPTADAQGIGNLVVQREQTS